MILIYSKTQAVGATYQEILNVFNPLLTSKKDDFLKNLSDAKLIIIDDDEEILKAVLNEPKSILFIGKNVPSEEISFLQKPLSSSVLLARVGLLMRQIEKGLFTNFQTSHYNFNAANRTLNDITLTQKETELIEYLWENKDKIVTKDELLKEIFGYKEGVETHTLETHIYKLRQKINETAEALILTIDGGYRLNLK